MGLLLSDGLKSAGMPFVQRQLSLPTVVALQDGTLDIHIAQEWLGQDYLFLLEARRFFARLIWQAPADHIDDLIAHMVDLSTTALEGQQELCQLFDINLSKAQLRSAGLAYTQWLLERAGVYEEGLIAQWAGMWGYTTLGSMMTVPVEQRLAAWVLSYRDPDFLQLVDRYEDMVNELTISPERAEEVFLEGMNHEIAFWDPL
jgi:thiaminase (transcriptional activator TenA)